MATLRQAQTGNRVYGAGGTAPNRGQVSAKGAQGYLQREMRNRNQGGVRQPVGNDGKSDSRSGVAAGALNRQLGGRPNMQGGKGKKPAQSGTPMMQNQPQNPNAVNPNQQGISTVPQIKVNDQGRLELPYNQNFSASALQALNGSNDELAQLQIEEQQMAQQTAQERRDTDLQYKQLQQQSLAGNASAGTAYSSQYGKAVVDNATAYSNTLGDIQRRESDFAQQASSRRAAIQNALAQQLAQEGQEYGNELMMEEAGSLGYGTSEPAAPHEHKGAKKSPPKKTPPKKATPSKSHGGPVKATGGPVKKGKK